MSKNFFRMEYVVFFNGIVANEAPETSQVRRWLLGDEEGNRGRGWGLTR